MSATLLGMWPTGSPEWHRARAGAMTGSRIAAVMGLSPYESRFSLWYRMRGEIGEPVVTPPMEWGNRLEAAVADKFADEHPEWAVDVTGLWRNDSRPWQLATPDRLVDQGGPDTISEVLEVKTARFDDGWGEPGTDQIPVHYRCQVLWYLDTLGLETAHVAVLISGSDYREYTVTLDDLARSDIKIMRVRAREFLDSIETDQRPSIDGDDATYDAIKEMHPDIDPVSIDVPDDIAVPLIESKAALDGAKRVHQHMKAELADNMGNAHYAYWHEMRIADRRARGLDATPYVQLANTLTDMTLETS